MIVVADFYRIRNEHVPVNAGLLYIISEEYADQEIHFYGEEEHIAAIRTFWTSNNLEISNVIFHQHRSKFANSAGIKMVLSRIASELFAVRRLSKIVSKEKDAVVFFLSLSSVTAIFQKLFFFKKTPSNNYTSR
jgi:hypothetical protein